MRCCASYGVIFRLWASERLRVIRPTSLLSDQEEVFSRPHFIAHCGNLFWAHQKVYNITQLSCLELWVLWCCLDSSRFCKQPGLVLWHKVHCNPHHILWLKAINVVGSSFAAPGLSPVRRDSLFTMTPERPQSPVPIHFLLTNFPVSHGDFSSSS